MNIFSVSLTEFLSLCCPVFFFFLLFKKKHFKATNLTSAAVKLENAKVTVQNVAPWPIGETQGGYDVKYAISDALKPQPQNGGAAVNDQWMNLLNSAIGSSTLSNVVIPGTHDSATAGINDSTGPSTAKTTTQTITQQLNQGIRYFDFRVREIAHRGCADPTTFVFYHGQAFGGAGERACFFLFVFLFSRKRKRQNLERVFFLLMRAWI